MLICETDQCPKARPQLPYHPINPNDRMVLGVVAAPGLLRVSDEVTNCVLYQYLFAKLSPIVRITLPLFFRDSFVTRPRFVATLRLVLHFRSLSYRYSEGSESFLCRGHALFFTKCAQPRSLLSLS
jgi:hypothetical protein